MAFEILKMKNIIKNVIDTITCRGRSPDYFPSKTIDRKTIYLLLAIFLFAFFLRSIPFLGITFVDNRVIFCDTDPYYHMRRIVHMLENNFNNIGFDYYLNYPEGAASFWPYGFEKLVAYFVWILSAGNPSKEFIEQGACWFPPLMGAATIFLVWLIGRELFSNKVGLLAAFLFALQPTHIDYSRLGKIDHHVAEVFSAILIYYCFVKVLKLLPKINFWSALTGVAIWFSYVMWSGATLYVMPLYATMYISLFVIQPENYKKYLLSYLFITVTALLFLLYPCLTSYYSKYDAIHFLTGKTARFTHDALSLFQISMFIGISAFFAFILVAFRLLKPADKKMSVIILSGTTLVFLIFSLGISKIFIPRIFTVIVEGVSLLAKKGMASYHVWLTTISEYQPLLYIEDRIVWQRAILSLSWMVIFMPVAMIVLVVKIIRQRSITLIFLLLTALFFGLLSFQQLRYCYISGFYVALLGAWTVFIVYEFLKENRFIEIKLNIKPVENFICKIKNILPFKKYPKFNLAGIFVLFFIYLVLKQFQMYSMATFSPMNRPIISPEDYDTLVWIKNNTPDAKFYNSPTQKPLYGIMNIWDWGHFIEYLSERPAAVNPYGMGIDKMVNFYLAKTEREANKIMDQNECRYVITADPTPVIDGLRKVSMLYPGETYRFLQFEGPMLRLPKQEFLNLMGVKLHLHNGVKPYVPDMDVEGLQHYRLVYESPEISELQYVGGPVTTQKLKIFEYVKGAKYVLKTKPNTEVKIDLELETNTGRKFIYENRVNSNITGNIEIFLPYSTSGSKYPVKAQGKYKIIADKKEFKLNVPEDAVLTGKTL
jgi:dolichyl-diphosphooligosaccharide--protein glycosyltransferase